MTEEIKRGARNNRRDSARLQQIHDYAVENGAHCMEKKSGDMEGGADEGETKALAPDDMLINYGSAAKSFKSPDSRDFAIVYGGEDLSADFFDKDTEYGFAGATTKRVPILFHHAQTLETETKKKYRETAPIGEAELEITDDGVLIKEAILYNRKKYEDMLDQLGWSTGAASHAVVRETRPGGKYYIKQWILGELSLTPMSAEPRISNVIALKSLLPSDEGIAPKDEDVKKHLEGNTMDEKEIKAMIDESSKNLVELAESAATKAVEAVLDKLPEVKAAFGAPVQVTHDEADNEFKSIAEQMQAVKSAVYGGRFDPRLNRIKSLETKAVLGSNEGIPSQGGFLLEPTLVADFLMPVHEVGPFSSRARRMPVSSNSNYGWINGLDETSRATGSRWGGVRGYWLAEGAAKTASQPKFRRINWELHKIAVLQYATDEQLADAGQMNAIIRQSSAEELNFLVNDAILRGSGAGMPKGMLNGGALISATRTNATNIDHDDILRMINRLLPSSYANAVWFAHPDVQPEIDSLNFTAGSTGILSPYVSYTENGVTMLRGRPVVYNEFNPTLGSVGDLLLADMNDYLIWEKGGIEAASSIHVEFLTDQTCFRFVYRVDGQPASYDDITPYQGSTTRSPYVALAATT